MAEMTFQEAIDRTKEVANECGECAKEHGQLAVWLEELKMFLSVLGLCLLTFDRGARSCSKDNYCSSCGADMREE